MISYLLNKFKRKPQDNVFRVPAGWQVYAVGDIHGRADLLKKLHSLILEKSKAAPKKKKLVVYLGDYLDRGAHVRETIDELLSDPLPGFRYKHLMGNHEQFLLKFLDDPSIIRIWKDLGGDATLMSYGVDVSGTAFFDGQDEEIRRQLLNSMPRGHIEFIKNLEPFFRFGDYLFIHAGIRPGKALEDQKPEDIHWIRDDFLSSKQDHGVRIIHGHTITERVEEFPNRIGIDTGAFFTGVLSCAVLEDDQASIIHT